MTGLLVNVAAAIGQMAEDVESLEQVKGWARSWEWVKRSAGHTVA